MNVAFIYSFEQSSWKSCQTITTNLLETYKLVLKNQKQFHFNYNEQMNSFENLELAKSIVGSKMDQLVIVDHKPHIYELVKFLDKLYTKNKLLSRPEIILHVFGDFTLYGEQWLKTEPYLKKFAVKFICASDKQKDLISKFLKNKKDNIYKMPFPVDSNLFYFSKALRERQRKKLNVNDKQVLFLYTGRLSLQKKVVELTIDFIHFLKITNSNAILYLAGEFDDLGNPFTGIFYKYGEFCQRYMKILDNLDPKYKNNIKYVGNLTQEELLEYYNAADCFISMSAHNDEDYGMSPAEAICTGLPSILSDWAGYSSFKIGNSNGCSLIPTKINTENNSIIYGQSMLFKTLIKSLEDHADYQANREKLAKINNDHFSISGNVIVLKNILKSDSRIFAGFTSYMKELALAFKKTTAPFANYQTIITINYNKFYTKLYDSYLSK